MPPAVSSSWSRSSSGTSLLWSRREGIFIIAIFKRVAEKAQNFSEALELLLPLALLLLFTSLWGCTKFYAEYPGLVICISGVQFFLVTTKMIITTVSHVTTFGQP